MKTSGFIFFILLAAASCSRPVQAAEDAAEKDIIVSDELSNKKVNAFEEDALGHI